MKLKQLIGVLAAVMLANAAQAAVIGEIEGNNTASTAQNVNSAFSTGFQTGVIGSSSGWSWVSIDARQTANNTFDWYTFNVGSSSNWWFDIDTANDAEFGLWDSVGNLLFWQDDLAHDYASTGLLSEANDDSFLFPERSMSLNSGTYFMAIGTFNSWGSNGYNISGSTAGSYVLNISTDIAPVPLPATLALLGLGLVGLGVTRKLKS